MINGTKLENFVISIPILLLGREKSKKATRKRLIRKTRKLKREREAYTIIIIYRYIYRYI